jgi:arginine N-succinyltransferase
MTATDPATPRLRLRAAAASDLDALERMAGASAVGITTLPADRAALADRLERSAMAFATADDSSGEEIHLFVLEELDGPTPGRIVGTSGIAASAGFADRFYAYRNEMVVHASPALNASNRIHTLHLCHDLTGHTLLTSFYVEPEHEQGIGAQLLSRARLLFIAEHAERFSDRIAAESPGLADEAGRCPFWDAVGRRFFDMDYPVAEQLAGGRTKAFIAELMPHSPIYVPLLPEAAQWAVGQLHPVAEVPFSILLDEGFDTETYVDIFDGGPIVDARVAMLATVAASRRLRAAPADAAAMRDATPMLVATTARDAFAAVVTPAAVRGDSLRLPPAALATLGVAAGSTLRAAPYRGGGATAGGSDDGDHPDGARA